MGELRESFFIVSAFCLSGSLLLPLVLLLLLRLIKSLSVYHSASNEPNGFSHSFSSTCLFALTSKQKNVRTVKNYQENRFI